MEVTAFHADTGTDTVVVVSGCGPGRHVGELRLWPQRPDFVPVEFDGDEHRVEVPGLFESGLATVDGVEARFPVGDAAPRGKAKGKAKA